MCVYRASLEIKDVEKDKSPFVATVIKFGTYAQDSSKFRANKPF